MKPEQLTVNPKNRPLGTYICGNPGSGKSSLLQHQILWDIRMGHGVCVIDPAADLINAIECYLPPERHKDVIYFDTSMPIPIDFFSCADDDEREILVDDLVGMFDLEAAPRAKPLLQSIIYTLLEANEHPKMAPKRRATFLDINSFCIDPERMQEILNYCSEDRRREWSRKIQSDTIDAIIFRMKPFLNSKTLKTILGGRQGGLNINTVIAKKQILLITLKDSATDLFLGSLISSRIQLAVFRLGRQVKEESKRVPYYLYIDECNTILKFAENTFEKLLLRARKYKLCLILTNPLPSKLPDKIRESLGTFGTLVIFNLKPKDAAIFKDEIAPRFTPPNVMELSPFHAIARTNNQVARVETPSFLRRRPAPWVDDIKNRTLRDYRDNPCKPEDVRDNSGSDSTNDKNADAGPQKEKGRPPVPPLGTKQGNNPGPRR